METYHIVAKSDSKHFGNHKKHLIPGLSFRGLEKHSWHFHLVEIAHLIRCKRKSNKWDLTFHVKEGFSS